MADHRLPLIAAGIVIAGAVACAPVPAATPDPQAPAANAKAADFEAAIARLEKNDPQSPETLNARLGYADFLSGANGAGCQQQLAAAQSQLDIVAGKPAIDALLPLAPAQIADGEYKIHLARATCGGGHTPLKSELQQALEAARHAVILYRDALDYQSAAILQFDVAATDQQLGDASGALSALQAAIAMDRDFGLRKDAEDNSRLLLQWKSQPAGDGDVAALMQDFPVRTAEFKFNWADNDADVAVAVEENNLIHGKMVRSRGAIVLKRQIRADANGWTISNARGAASYELGDWPPDAKVSEWSMLYFLACALLQVPGIEIGKDGDFKTVPDAEGFGKDLGTQIFAKISEQAGGSASANPPASNDAVTLNVSPAFSPEGAAMVRTLSPAFSPEFIEAKAEQDYGLQTATWIGAKLDQGVWYQMQTPLFLPGLGLGLYTAQHNVSFAFTRQVPCAAGSPDHLCAEIVIHAAPDAKDLESAFKEASQDLELSDRQSLHYWPRTDLRLVIDPETLLPYVCDMTQSWYDGVGKNDPIIESIRTVSTFVYH